MWCTLCLSKWWNGIITTSSGRRMFICHGCASALLSKRDLRKGDDHTLLVDTLSYSLELE